jgi:hypothetical protein
MCVDALDSYYFTASASNAVGMSRVSEPVVFYTQASVPSAPILQVRSPQQAQQALSVGCAAPSATDHLRNGRT